MSFWKWSRTAANNATADGSINWAQGQAPSMANDCAARAVRRIKPERRAWRVEGCPL
jgi:hypothetical protein